MTDPSLPIRVGIVHANGATTLDVGGEVDMATAPALGARLAAVVDAGTGDVTVDLTDVTFLDSSGLAVLVMALRRLGASDRRLTVRSPSRSVTRVLELSGVAGVLDGEWTVPLAGD